MMRFRVSIKIGYRDLGTTLNFNFFEIPCKQEIQHKMEQKNQKNISYFEFSALVLQEKRMKINR